MAQSEAERLADELADDLENAADYVEGRLRDPIGLGPDDVACFRAAARLLRAGADSAVRLSALIEGVRAVGKHSHWDAPHWTLHVPKREADALFDLAYQDGNPALAAYDRAAEEGEA